MLLISIALAAIPFASAAPNAPAQVVAIVLDGEAVVSWVADGSADAYRVYGFNGSEQVFLYETAENWAQVPADYERFGVTAVVGTSESLVAYHTSGQCIQIEQPGEVPPATLSADCGTGGVKGLGGIIVP